MTQDHMTHQHLKIAYPRLDNRLPCPVWECRQTGHYHVKHYHVKYHHPCHPKNVLIDRTPKIWHTLEISHNLIAHCPVSYYLHTGRLCRENSGRRQDEHYHCSSYYTWCKRFHTSKIWHVLKFDTSVDRTDNFSHPKKRCPQNRVAKSPVYATTTIRHYDVLRENTLKQVIFVRVRRAQ